MTKSSLRRLLVVPAVMSLALGGALLTANSASAAVGNLVITAPEANSTVASRTVDFTGTAAPGSSIRIHAGDSDAGAVIASDDSVGNDGAWSATAVYTDTDPVAETVFVDGVLGGSGFSDAQALSFNLPAVVTPFAVTTPTVGQVETSRTVAVSGTGSTGSTVSVTDATGKVLIPGNLVVSNDQWSGTVTFADDAATAQTLRFQQTTGGAGRGDVSVPITLPAATPAAPVFAVTSPTPNQVETSRTVAVSGTGSTGSTVSVTDATGKVLIPGNLVVSNDQWSGTVTFADDAATAQTLRFQQTTGGAGRGDISVDITLPAVTTTPTATVAAPVITSPKNGDELTGNSVTFTGTGTPGSNILLIAVPTSSINSDVARAQAAVQPADPTDPIVVDADGNWTVTLAATPNDYTAQATAFLLDANGDPVVDANGDPVVSDPSNQVEFVLTAAATVITPSDPGANGSAVNGNTPGGSLAFTGSNPAPVIGLGALLAAAGVAISLIARRRRSLIG